MVAIKVKVHAHSYIKKNIGLNLNCLIHKTILHLPHSRMGWPKRDVTCPEDVFLCLSWIFTHLCRAGTGSINDTYNAQGPSASRDSTFCETQKKKARVCADTNTIECASPSREQDTFYSLTTYLLTALFAVGN